MFIDIRQMAMNGNFYAAQLLAIYYLTGENMRPNPAEAFKLFLNLAERGFPSATFAVGALYGNGIGVEKNIDKAFEYFELAFKIGCSIAKDYTSREGDPSELFKKSLEHFGGLKQVAQTAILAGIDFEPKKA
jgi:hypothetical protein